MTFDQLTAFITISELGSFQAASKSLHISQPAISHAIKKLEEDLGLVLFDRSHYRAELSPHGKRLLAYAKSLIRQQESMYAAAAVLAKGQEDQIRIAVGDLCPEAVTIDLLHRFFKDVKGCRMVLLFEGVFGPVERVLNGEADFGLSSIPEHCLDQLETLALLRTKLIPVVAHDHDLAKTQRVYQADLQSHVQIVIRDTSSQAETLALGVSPEQNLRCSVSDQTKKLRLIESGLGWGRLPEYLALPGIAGGQLKQLKSPDIAEPEFTIYAYQKRSTNTGPISQRLWQYLSACQPQFAASLD